MNTTIQKGKVSNVLDGGRSVVVTPYSGGIVTVPLTVPGSLAGALAVNTPVVYILFDDNTGMILSDMEGHAGGAGGGITVTTEGDAIIISTLSGGV